MNVDEEGNAVPNEEIVIVPLVSLFTRKPDKALVENAFSSYDKKVLVYQREALADEESE